MEDGSRFPHCYLPASYKTPNLENIYQPEGIPKHFCETLAKPLILKIFIHLSIPGSAFWSGLLVLQEPLVSELFVLQEPLTDIIFNSTCLSSIRIIEKLVYLVLAARVKWEPYPWAIVTAPPKQSTET